MCISTTSRPARRAGRALLAIALCAGVQWCVAAETTDDLLRRADQLKTADNSAFMGLLGQIDASPGLNAVQHDWLDYLRAWQLGYEGRYAEAVTAFDTLLAHAHDATVVTRARISLVNDQVNASHYEDAYANVAKLIEALPQVQDRTAHFLSLSVAATAYNQAGQYDLALRYADAALAYDRSDRSICISTSDKADTLSQIGKLNPDDAEIRGGLDACRRIDDTLYANVIRTYQAQALLAAGRNADALQLLHDHDAEMLGTHSAAANSLFRSVMARAALRAGDFAHAREYAQSAVEHGIKQAYSKWVADAYAVLYEVAKREGDAANALTYHEKYAEADKGYLNDTSTRALAYQMVHQQVLDKKRQIDALNEKNQVLQLRQEIDAKSAEAERLYIVLLAVMLASICFWSYRIKRSQLKFKKLARRDGLTGIFNRQHFFETASDVLRYCKKSSRDASVLVMDLDHFKLVNDTHGHAAGDLALKRVVAICQAHLRSIDLFGRLGGEEFAILLPDCAQGTAAQRANEIRDAIAKPGSDAANAFGVTASFGVAATAMSGYVLQQLLADADAALYAAKDSGRNRVAVHQPPATPAGTPVADAIDA